MAGNRTARYAVTQGRKVEVAGAQALAAEG
jgi:hypothetical protein